MSNPEQSVIEKTLYEVEFNGFSETPFSLTEWKSIEKTKTIVFGKNSASGSRIDKDCLDKVIKTYDYRKIYTYDLEKIESYKMRILEDMLFSQNKIIEEVHKVVGKINNLKASLQN